MSEFETRAAIRELLSAYSGAAGRLDVEAFCNLFTPDAEIHGVAPLLGRPDPLKGEQIRDFFGASFGNLEWLVQMNNITDVTLGPDGKTATASTGLIENAKLKQAAQITLIGRYDDKLILTPKGWRFTQRSFTPYRFGPAS